MVFWSNNLYVYKIPTCEKVQFRLYSLDALFICLILISRMCIIFTVSKTMGSQIKFCQVSDLLNVQFFFHFLLTLEGQKANPRIYLSNVYLNRCQKCFYCIQRLLCDRVILLWITVLPIPFSVFLHIVLSQPHSTKSNTIQFRVCEGI